MSRKFRFRKSKTSKKSKSALALAKANKRALAKLDKLIEVKYFYDQLIVSPVKDDGTDILNISELSVAAGRVGDDITIRRTEVKGIVKRHASATIPCLVRIIIFYKKDNTVPNSGNVLKQVEALGFRSTTYANTIHVLSDTLYTLEDSKRQVKFKGGSNKEWVMKFDGALGTSIADKNLYVMMISDQTVNMPEVAMNVKLTYSDA